ncbi:Nucleoporin nup84, partial [Friedmanniomyces endolithicus]
SRVPSGRGAWDFVGVNDDEDEDEDEVQQNGVRESVEVEHYTASQNPPEEEGGEDEEGGEGSSDVEASLKPLREMADKVGREVEAFAVSFDQFLAKVLTERKDGYQSARDLVGTYRVFAEEEVERLKVAVQRERMVVLREEWSRRAELA